MAQDILDRRPDLARLATGISMFDMVELARKKALHFPVLGDFLAEVIVPDGSSLPVERTTTSRGPLHAMGQSRGVAPIGRQGRAGAAR